MIVICVNELAGPTGYHKAVIDLANGLRDTGYAVSVVPFSQQTGTATGSWTLDPAIPVMPLAEIAAGASTRLPLGPGIDFDGLDYRLTPLDVVGFRELNRALTADDTLFFTSPWHADAFRRSLDGDARNPRTVLQIHNDLRTLPAILRMTLDARDQIDTVQTLTEGSRDQFVESFGVDRVLALPNFPSADGTAIAPVEHHNVNIAFPASFQPRKNQLDAVRALARIPDPSVHLWFWGRVDARNPYPHAIRSLARTLKVESRVHLPGFGSEHDIYATADVVLMTSWSEGFPYGLVEAALHGKPCVTYDFDFGPRDIIDDGTSGYVVPLGDVDALAARLTELAASAPLRTGFGRRAREVYEATLTRDSIAARYAAMLGPADRGTAVVATSTPADGSENGGDAEPTGASTWSVGTWIIRITTFLWARVRTRGHSNDAFPPIPLLGTRPRSPWARVREDLALARAAFWAFGPRFSGRKAQ